MKTLRLLEPTPEHKALYNFKGDFDTLAKTIMSRLHKDFDIADQEFNCGVTLGDLLQSQELKDLAVMTLGNDFNTSCFFLQKLRLHGDGVCPNCGSDNYQIIDGNAEMDGDFGAFAKSTVMYVIPVIMSGETKIPEVDVCEDCGKSYEDCVCTSPCCSAPIIYGDICSECKEHCI